MDETVDLACRRLLNLASGLAQSSAISIEVSDDQWGWQPERRVLKVARDSISTYGVEHCYGYIAHEIGHILISRYFAFDHSRWSPCVGLPTLNAIEDPRVEAFMERRFPGVQSWIEQVYRISRHEDISSEVFKRMPGSVQFGMGAVEEYHDGWQPTQRDFSAPVHEALNQTRDARRRYVETLPSEDLVGDSGNTETYFSEVVPQLDQPMPMPSTSEMAIFVSAWQAFHLASAEILPAAQRLHEIDVTHIATVLTQEPGRLTGVKLLLDRLASTAVLPESGALLRRLVGEMLQASTSSVLAPVAVALSLADRLLNALWESLTTQSEPGLAGACGTPLGFNRGESGEIDSRPVPPSHSEVSDAYEDVRLRNAAAIDRLVRSIEAVLVPRRRPRVKGGYASGTRIDLRRAMACEADPRGYDAVWQRRSLPDRTDLAVFVLVDLSGSMASDGKDEAAMAGTVILAETLGRISHVRWAAAGFQDELIPFADFGEGLTARVRKRIGSLMHEIHNRAPGGHNCSQYNDDGPAVVSALEQLLSMRTTGRMLIVVSDGGPAGRHSDMEDLRRAVSQVLASGVDLIGVGLGAGTKHVREFYPRHIAEVPVDEFPHRMGVLVREVLTR